MNITRRASRILTQTCWQDIESDLPKILPNDWIPHLTKCERWRWCELLPKFGFCRAKSSLVNWASNGEWPYMGVATLVKKGGMAFVVVMADSRIFSRALGSINDSNRLKVLSVLENGCVGFPSMSSTAEMVQHQMLREELYNQTRKSADFGVLLSLGELYLSESM